jgi:hypothetical protein
MKAERVRSRLAALRERYVPETVAEARQRLAAERPAREPTPTARSVARALEELRALCELSAVLQRRR